ncbi:MAG: aspartyl/glutamyl-tRNA amidotransferase subunit A [Synergistaceae bacterium]|nr:aspartyl/glutamyl-tRNA amidotransferase subunit A [Synergistaceae bacterium]
MRFRSMGAREIAAGVREKKFSAAEVFEECLRTATDCEDRLSALAAVTAEAGRIQAKRVDEKVAKGEDPGLLAGVPVVIKDNICANGIRTAAGSRILGDWVPPYDATAWSLLADQGAVLLGKGSMDELATGVSDGSAAAVAAGYVPFSLGSDTGGSIRLPASYCGIYGLKPTYGLVSRYGMISYGSSLDQIGPFTRSVEDMELVMRVLARHDPKDSTSVSKNEIFARRTNTLKGRRIALVKEFMDFSPTLDQITADAMKRTIRLFEESGSEVIEVSLPTVARYAAACYYTIAASEAYTNFARFDGVRCGRAAEAAGLREMFETTRSEGFDGGVKSRIIVGTYLSEPDCYEKYYVAATRVRTLIAEEFYKTFDADRIDCILQPVTPSLSGKIGELNLYTLTANVAGLPAFSLPAGLQIIGPRWSDGELLDIGLEVEKISGAPKIAYFLQRR